MLNKWESSFIFRALSSPPQSALNPMHLPSRVPITCDANQSNPFASSSLFRQLLLFTPPSTSLAHFAKSSITSLNQTPSSLHPFIQTKNDPFRFAMISCLIESPSFTNNLNPFLVPLRCFRHVQDVRGCCFVGSELSRERLAQGILYVEAPFQSSRPCCL